MPRPRNPKRLLEDMLQELIQAQEIHNANVDRRVKAEELESRSELQLREIRHHIAAYMQADGCTMRMVARLGDTNLLVERFNTDSILLSVLPTAANLVEPQSQETPICHAQK